MSNRDPTILAETPSFVRRRVRQSFSDCPSLRASSPIPIPEIEQKIQVHQRSASFSAARVVKEGSQRLRERAETPTKARRRPSVVGLPDAFSGLSMTPESPMAGTTTTTAVIKFHPLLISQTQPKFEEDEDKEDLRDEDIFDSLPTPPSTPQHGLRCAITMAPVSESASPLFPVCSVPSTVTEFDSLRPPPMTSRSTSPSIPIPGKSVQCPDGDDDDPSVSSASFSFESALERRAFDGRVMAAVSPPIFRVGSDSDSTQNSPEIGHGFGSSSSIRVPSFAFNAARRRYGLFGSLNFAASPLGREPASLFEMRLSSPPPMHRPDTEPELAGSVRSDLDADDEGPPPRLVHSVANLPDIVPSEERRQTESTSGQIRVERQIIMELNLIAEEIEARLDRGDRFDAVPVRTPQPLRSSGSAPAQTWRRLVRRISWWTGRRRVRSENQGCAVGGQGAPAQDDGVPEGPLARAEDRIQRFESP